MLTAQPLQAQKNQAAKSNKVLIWFARQPFKKREKSIKAPGFCHNFALEPCGNLPFQRRYYLEIWEVGSGAGCFTTPKIGSLPLETELVHPDQVLYLSQDAVKRPVRPGSDGDPRVPGNRGTSLSFLVPPRLQAADG